MIPIHKTMPIPELEDLRIKAERRNLSPQKAYSRLKNPLREEVLSQLIEEQGHLCAYCMCPIPRNDVDPGISSITIEHIIPENPEDGRDVGQGLDYYNFLAVCNGNKAGRGKRKHIDLTCDAYRGNTEFKKVNPCIPETLSTIFYTLDGMIDAEDEAVKYDLQNTLNLNCLTSSIIAERKEVLAQLMNDMEVYLENDQLLQYCEERLAIFENETGQKSPYVGILIWYLKTMIDAIKENNKNNL